MRNSKIFSIFAGKDKNELFKQYKGALTEQFVLQELQQLEEASIAHNHGKMFLRGTYYLPQTSTDEHGCAEYHLLLATLEKSK